MTNSAGNNGDNNHQSNPNSDDYEKRLSDLSKKLSKVKGQEEQKTVPEHHNTSRSYSYALRIATELIAAPVVGVFIGWWLDKTLGTTPLLLLIFLVFGFAAGIKNVVRTAAQMQEQQKDGGKDDSETK